MDIRIGTSGCSCADWKGQFYRRGIKNTEMLRYYAARFPVVELNTSYYGIPKPETLRRMTEEVPRGFEFVVQAHKDMTHGEGALKAEVFEEFREAMTPLREAGMLGAVLAQFPFGFGPSPE